MQWIPAPWHPRRLVGGFGLLMTDGVVAVVYISLVTAAITVVVSTFVLAPVAAVLLWWTLVVAGWLARLERSRFAALVGVEIEPTTHARTKGNPWRRFLAAVRSETRWRELAYFVVQPIWGLIAFVAAILIWAPALSVIAYAITGGWRSGLEPLSGVADKAWHWPAICVGASLWLVAVAPPATFGLTTVDTALAQRLLAPPEKDPRRVAARAESGRAAAVAAADLERRRIERDLHDGAQQRLIAIAMELDQARSALPARPEAARALVEHSHAEVKGVLRDLRDLVRGLRPVILEDRGLDAALSSVVARCPFPVSILVEVEPRPSAAVEGAAYFAVSEALTNTMRYADASRATVNVIRVGDVLRVTVTDNGRGGAAPATGHAGPTSGSGLAGLIDRAEALGGHVTIDSPIGGPTRIQVELPCES